MSLEDLGIEEVPAYCEIAEEVLEERRPQVEDLMRRAEAVEALEDGYAFTFPGDQETLALVVGFAMDERRCCPMGTFELAFQGEGEAVTFAFRGPDPMKEDMREGLQLDRWFGDVPA